MARAVDLLRRAASPQGDSWQKHDLFDAVFYLRMVVAGVMGVGYGLLGAQGLLVFLSFMGINMFVASAWLRWQGVDEAEFEDPEKITQQPLSLEGFGPGVSFFLLTWVTSFTLAHAS